MAGRSLVVGLIAAAAVGVGVAGSAGGGVTLSPACDGLFGPECPRPRCDAAPEPVPAAPGARRDPREDVAVSTGGRVRLGVHSNSATLGVVTPEEQAAWAVRAHAAVARFAVDWHELEPRRDRWDEGRWRRVQRVAAALAARGVEPLAVLTGAPKWIAPARDRFAPRLRRSIYIPIANLDGDRRWRRFVAEAVRRLPGVRLFELWNEPNLRGPWGGHDPDPVHYAHLVREAYPVVKRLRPASTVLAGAVAAAGARPFVRCLFAPGGIGGHFDAFSLHVYPARVAGRTELALGAGSAFRAQLRDVVDEVRRHAPQARFWVTETGVTTSGPPVRVSAAEQAAWARHAWNVLAARPEIDGVVFHALFDAPRRPASDPERGFGWVVPPSGTRPARPRPVLRAFAARSAG